MTGLLYFSSMQYNPGQLGLSNSSSWSRCSREIKGRSESEQPAIAVTEINNNSYSCIPPSLINPPHILMFHPM